MENKPDTRRKFTRIHFDRSVKLEFADDRYYSKVKDLSLTGMFITGDFQKHKGKYCLIDLYQKRISADLSLRASAKDVRKDGKGIAIQFVSMPLDSYIFLQSMFPEPENLPFETTDGSPTFPMANVQFNN